VRFCRTQKNAFQLSHRSWNKPGLASGRSPDLRVNEAECLPRSSPQWLERIPKLSSQRLQLRGSGGFTPRFPNTRQSNLSRKQNLRQSFRAVRSWAKQKSPPFAKAKSGDFQRCQANQPGVKFSLPQLAARNVRRVRANEPTATG
jgi:hypothetical protein